MTNVFEGIISFKEGLYVIKWVFILIVYLLRRKAHQRNLYQIYISNPQ